MSKKIRGALALCDIFNRKVFQLVRKLWSRETIINQVSIKVISGKDFMQMWKYGDATYQQTKVHFCSKVRLYQGDPP
jgi:hypothetical protein